MASSRVRFPRFSARSTGLLRALWKRSRKSSNPVSDPLHCDVPVLRDAEMAAVYHGQRLGGDFYEFRRVSSSRVLFALMDVAGRRADTRELLIAVQQVFADLAVQLFSPEPVNEAEGMSALCHEINRTILQRSRGVRSCPAFIGCYNEDLATLMLWKRGSHSGPADRQQRRSQAGSHRPSSRSFLSYRSQLFDLRIASGRRSIDRISRAFRNGRQRGGVRIGRRLARVAGRNAVRRVETVHNDIAERARVCR